MIGYSCWNGVEGRRDCDASIEMDSTSYDDLDEKAGAEGWVIGHFDGQAHYACPRCVNTLFDPIVLHRMRP